MILYKSKFTFRHIINKGEKMIEANKTDSKREKIIEIESVCIYELIKTIIHDSKTSHRKVNDVKYHHNRSYTSTPTVIKKGILSMSESVKIGALKFSELDLQKYNEENHVNGTASVSLASTDVDHSKLYRGEMVYCPFFSGSTDILISGNVKAYRNTTNYYNEFLADSRIMPENFRSVDIRILKNVSNNPGYNDNTEPLTKLQKKIEKYNNLRNIALAILESDLDIPLREMSEEEITLDLEKISKGPILVLK